MMETTSTIQTQRTSTVLFAFIARLVGLRSYKPPILPSEFSGQVPLSMGKRKTISLLLAWLFVLVLPLHVHAQCGSSSTIVTLKTQTDVNNFLTTTYPSCTNFLGTIIIDDDDNGMDNITSLAPLAALTSVNNLFIVNNDVLTTIDALTALTSVSGGLVIENNKALTNINGLAALKSVGSNLFIKTNLKLTNIDGLAALTSVSGQLNIQTNAALTNINGLAALKSVGASLLISSNTSLTNIDGLTALTYVGGPLMTIQNNASLTNLDGLAAFTSVVGGLYITNNASLTNLDGLAALTSVGNDLYIKDNILLSKCCGLYPIINADVNGGGTAIGGTITLSGNLMGCNSTAEILSGGRCPCASLATATETMTWTGAVSTDWNNACNWSPNGIPTATNPVSIPDVANDPVILSGTTAYAFRMKIDNFGSLTVNIGGELNVLTTSNLPVAIGILITANATLTNRGTLNILSTASIEGIRQGGNTTFTNSGIVNMSTSNLNIVLTTPNITITNEASGVINFQTGRGFNISNNPGIVINNQGTMNYTSGNLLAAITTGTTFNNSGTIDIRSGLGITMQGGTMNNLACGKILMSAGNYDNQSSTTTNAGLLYIRFNLDNTDGTFTNTGVLKYGSLTGTVTNSGNGSVIVKNMPMPTFTYGGTYDGTIDGIFTDAAATTSAGTFTAPNTFAPSGLPPGSQTLYAKITPSGGACTYIVPFTYNNTTCTPVATATEIMTWTGALNTNWNNACNWSPNGVPTATNPVNIPDVDKDPIISSGTSVAKSIEVTGSGASLTVNAGATLTLSAEANTVIISNSGQLTNRGTINATNTTPTTNSTVAFGLGQNVTLDNYGTLNLTASQNNGLEIGDNSTFRNYSGGNIVINARGGIRGGTGTIINNAGATITVVGSNSGIQTNGIISNSGMIDVTGIIEATNPTQITNNACGIIKLTGDYFNSTNATTVNNGFMSIGGALHNNSTGTFTNSGVFIYGSLKINTVFLNSGDAAVVVNNALTPIFTYGGTYNGTINGIFTNAAATTSAGTFTAPNTFVPSGSLTTGQTLYAKITPQGGACSYVVPFVYARPFVSTWKLDAGATTLSVSPETVGEVAYVWTTVPTGTSGFGVFNQSFADIAGIPAGATIELNISPTNFRRINISNGIHKSRLLEIKQWGDVAWTTMENAFNGCNNLEVTATDNPNLGAVTNMTNMFRGATKFNQDISDWNIAGVTNMSDMFNGATAFNQSLAAWGTKFNANVTLTGFLNNCGMNIANYDATLTGFNAGSVTGRSMGATNLKYCASAADRANLVKSVASGGKGWTITGDASGAPTISVSSQTNVLCNGSTTGAFSFTVAGGTGTKTVVVKDATNNTVATTGTNPYTVSGRAAGAYSINVTDAASCSASQSVTLTQPTALSIGTVSTTNATCATGGTVTVIGTSGGTGSYTFKLSASLTNMTGSFTNVTSGNYTLTVTDANSCESTISVSVGNSSAPTISVSSQTNILCNGGTTGAFSFTVAGGTGTKTVVVKDAANNTVATTGTNPYTVSGRAAGAYSINVTDAASCSVSQSVTLTQPTALSIGTVSATNATCAAGGTVTITGTSGGTGAYTFKLSSSLTNNTGSFINVTSGNYTLTVTDGNSCESTTSVSVGNSSAPTITLSSQTNILCNGGTTGAFSFTVSGGTGAKTVVVKDAANNTVATTGTAPYTVSGRAAGVYSISVTDAANCSASQSVTLTQPTALSIGTVSTTNATCATGGTVTITGTSGGTGAYTFKLSSSLTNNTGSFTNVTSGNYTLTVTDANSCESTTSVSVGNSSAPTITLSSQINILCNGGTTGAFSFTVSGGTGAKTVVVKDAANNTVATTGTAPYTVSGRAAGVYSISVTDAANCSASQSVTLTQPTALSIGTVSTTNATCATGGTVTITGTSGGTGAYTFKLSSSLTNNTGSFTNVTSGNYTLTVTDANSCESTTSVSVGNSSAPTITLSSQINILCNGGTTGAFSFTVSGGTGAKTVVVKDAANNTVATTGTNPYTVSGRVAGAYSISVTDAANCSTSQSVTLTQPTALSISVASKQDKDCTHATGSVMLTVGGGTGSLQVSLDGQTYQSGLTFNNLAPNSYTATVKDANSCTKTVNFSIIDNGTTPSAPTVENVFYCLNETPSVLTATGMNLKWYADATGGIGDVNVPTPSTANVGTVSYWVSQTTGLCESGRAKIDVTTRALPIVLITGLNAAYCKDATAVTLTGNPSGGTFKIDGNTATQFAPSVLSVGNHTVVYSYTDGNGCSNTTSKTVAINALPVVSITGLNAAYCKSASAVTLTGSPTGGSFTIDGTTATQLSPSVLSVGNHTVVYTYSDGNGCSNTTSQTVAINALPVVSITGLNAAYCKSASAVTLTGSPTGGSFTIDGTVATSLSPSVLSIGNHTVVYTYSDGNGCSNTTSKTVVINALPVVSITGLNAAYCKSASAVTLTGSPTGGSFTIDGTTATQLSPSVLSVGNHTVVYTYSDGNGCSNTTSQTVAINALPVVSITGLNAAYCKSASAVTLTGSPTGGSFTIDGTAATQLSPSVLSVGNHTVIYTYSDGNGCSNTTSKTVAINALPSVSITGLNAAYCKSASAVTLTGSPTGGSFTIDGTAATQLSPSVLSVGNHTVVYSYTDGNGCSNTTSKTVAINVLPSVSITGLNAAYCKSASAVTLTGNPTGGSFTIDGTAATSLSPSVLSIGNHTVVYTYSDGNGCSNTTSQTVAINALPVVSITGLNTAYCKSASAVTLTGSPTGGSFTIDGTTATQLSPSVLSVGNHTVVYTYSDGNGCSNTTSQTVAINALPIVSITGLNTAYCKSASAVTLTGSPTGGSFTIDGTTATQLSPSVLSIGNHTVVYTYSDGNGCGNTASQTVAINALPSVSITGLNTAYCKSASAVTLTGSPTGGSFTIDGTTATQLSPSILSVGNHTVVYTYSDGNGCGNTASQTVAINALPVVSITGLNAAYCKSASAVTLTGSPTGGSFTIDGTAATQLSPSVLSVGNHTVVYSYTDGNGCSNTTSKTLAINALPVVSITGLNTAYCKSASAVTLTGSPTGGSFTIDGTAATQLSPSVLSIGNHTVVYTYSDGNGCGNTASQTVAINALPSVSITGLNAAYCKSASAVTLTGNPTGGSFTIDGTVATSLSPSVLSIGNHTVVYTYSDGNGCGNTASQTVAINALPSVSITGLNAAYCKSASAVTLTGSPTGGSFTIDGTAATSLSPSVLSIGNHTVVYTYSDGNGCSNTTSQTVAINALPVVSITGLNAAYCKSASAVTLTGSPTGGSFTIDGTTATQLSPSVLSVGNHTVVYTYSDGNGCSNTTSQTVVINALPVVSITGLNAAYCKSASAVTLTGSPTGGSFTIDGTTATQLSPSVLSVGNHTVVYTYSDGNGCSNTTSQTVVINALPVVSITGLNAAYCKSASAVTLTGSPTGGSFTIDGTAATSLSPSVLSIGNHTVVYTYSDDNGCSNTTSKTVAINALPSVSITGLNAAYCKSASAVTLTGNPIGGSFTIDGTTAMQLSPSVLSVGNHTVIYTYSDGNGCSNTTSQTVAINALPSVSITGLNAAYCKSASAVTLTGSPTGGSFTIDGTTATQLSPSVLSVGNHTVVYTYSDGNGCRNTTSKTVAINALPSVSITGLNAAYCKSSSAVTLTGSPTGGSFKIDGTSATQLNPSVLIVGNHTVVYTYSDGNGCTNSTSQIVTVNALPVVSITGLNTAYCKSASAVTLTGTPSGGTFRIDGNIDTQFAPSVLSVGNHTVVYSYTDGNGCANTTSQTVAVNALPVVSIIGLNAIYCKSASAVTLAGSPTGGSFTIDGTVATSFDPSVLSVGNHTVVYTYVDGNSCSNTATAQVMLSTAVTFVGNPSVTDVSCTDGNDGRVVVSASGGAGAISYAINPNTGFQNPVGSFNNLTAQTYTFTATDANSCIATTTAIVTTKVNIAPTITLTSPTNGSVTATNVVLSATASDAGGAIGHVNFYWVVGVTKTGTLSRVLLHSDNTAPYTYTWANVVGGNYNIQAEAVDNCGKSTFSTISSVNVLETFTVAITSPTNGQSFVPGSELTIAASVIPYLSRTVSKVEFYANYTKLGEDLTAPYTYVWANAPSGNFTLMVKAIDNTGAAWSSPLYFITGLNEFNTPQRNAGSNNNSGLTMIVSPNPATTQVVVNTNISEEGDYTLSLTDLLGQVVVSKKVNYVKGANTEVFDISSFSKGIYVVRLVHKEGISSVVQKLIIH